MIRLTKGVTWLVILSCVVALAVAAPASSEESSSSEESTTISASTLPGQVSEDPQITAVKTKRNAQGDTPVSSVDRLSFIGPAILPPSTTSNPAGTTAKSLQKRNAQGDNPVSSADKQTLISPAIYPASTTSNPAITTTKSLQKRDAQGDYPASSADKQTLISPAIPTATTTSNPAITTTRSLQKRDAQGDNPVSSADKQSVLSPAITTATTTSNPAVTTTKSLQKRQTETQTTVKPQADSVSGGSLTNPASPADSSSRVARTGEAQKPEPGTLPPDSPDNVKYTPKAKRDADYTTTTTPAGTTTKIDQKRGADVQEPVAVSKISEPNTVLTPPDVSTTPNTRSVRDVEGLGQPERYAYKTATSSPQTDEKKQSLSTIPEVPQERSKRAANPQGFDSRKPQPGRPGDFGRPQPGRPQPGRPQPGRPGPPPPPPGRPGNRPGFPPSRPGGPGGPGRPGFGGGRP